MFIIPVLFISLVLVSTSFAQTASTTTGMVNNSASITTKKECVMTAKTGLKSAIRSANDVAKQAKIDAKKTRDESIKAAKANTDKAARDTAIKTAKSNYTKAVNDIRTTQKDSIKKAKSDYITASKACSNK